MDSIIIEKINYIDSLKYFSNNINILRSLNDLMNKTFLDEMSVEDGEDLDRDHLYKLDMSDDDHHTMIDNINDTMNNIIPFEGTFYIAYVHLDDDSKVVVGHVEIVLIDTLEYYNKKNTIDIDPDETIYNISGAGVRYEYRNKGICSKLLRAIINDFSAVDIHLSVFPGNLSAITCYKNIGFVEDQILEDEEDPIKYTTMIYHKKITAVP